MMMIIMINGVILMNKINEMILMSDNEIMKWSNE